MIASKWLSLLTEFLINCFSFKYKLESWKKTVKGYPELPPAPHPFFAIILAPIVIIGREVQKPLLKEASIPVINFAIVKIICKICIINIIKSLLGKTSDMTRVKGSLGRAGL